MYRLFNTFEICIFCMGKRGGRFGDLVVLVSSTLYEGQKFGPLSSRGVARVVAVWAFIAI